MRRMTTPRLTDVGPLQAVELPASSDAPIVVCMHGYGANAQDLVPIGMELDLKRPVRWIFPGAPLALPDFGPDSRAWFPIDERQIAALQLSGRRIDVSQLRPAGFEDAVTAAEQMLAALQTPISNVILGGFSQGAMMAVELASRAAQKPLGLFILSGTLVDEAGLRERLTHLKGLRYYQSHGSADPILDFQTALRLHEFLGSAGLVGEFQRFEGPHAVPLEVVGGLQRYIDSMLPEGAK